MPNETRTINIGRLANNDIVLPQRVVSRIHAALEWQSGQAVLTDQHSSNGTYVNGTRISEPTTLQCGDRVRLALNGPELTFPGDFPSAAPSTKEPSRRETAVYRDELRKSVNDTMARVQQAAQRSQIIAPVAVPPTPVVVVCRQYRELARLSPRAAVCEAWRVLENAVRHRHEQVFRRRRPSSDLNIYDIINALKDRSVIGPADVQALHGLRDMRNKAAHHTTFALAAAQAEAYAAQALNYVKAFKPDALEDIFHSVIKRGRIAV